MKKFKIVLFVSALLLSFRAGANSDELLLDNEVYHSHRKFLVSGGTGVRLAEYFDFSLSGSLAYRVAPKWSVYTEADVAEAPFESSAGPSTSEKMETYSIGARYDVWRWIFADVDIGHRQTWLRHRDRTSDPYDIAKFRDTIAGIGAGIAYEKLDPVILMFKVGTNVSLDRRFDVNTYTRGLSKSSVELKGSAGVAF